MKHVPVMENLCTSPVQSKATPWEQVVTRESDVHAQKQKFISEVENMITQNPSNLNHKPQELGGSHLACPYQT